MAFNKIKPVPPEYKMNAVIYARYSSEKQTENSIDGQLRACKQYCDKHGYTVIREYIDRAVSGTTDHRPEFQRMIEDSKQQKFAFVIVYRFDRFARNRFDSAMYKKQLELVGVRVLSVSENVGEGDEAIILESLYEAMDEAYSRRLGRITVRGMRETAMKGLWTGGNVPLGYRVEEQRLVIDEKEAPAVRMIFELYEKGKTKTQIAAALNENGFRTKKGNPFISSNFETILHNKMYYGDHSFHDVERTCPAIITKEQFDTVQALLEQNKKLMGRKAKDIFFAFTGKLFCGMCGTAMVGDSGTSRSGEKHYYYSCNRRKKFHDCKKKSERKDFLEGYVCEQTVLYILAPGNTTRIAEKIVEASQEDDPTADLIRLKHSLKNVNTQLRNAVDALIKTNNQIAIDQINEKLEQLTQQKNFIEESIARAEIRNDYKLTVPTVEAYLRKSCEGDLRNPEVRQRIIRTFINCLYIFDDKIVIYYNIKNTKQVSYIDVISELDELMSCDDCSNSIDQGEPEKNTCICKCFFR